MYTNEHIKELIEEFGLEWTIRKELIDTENIIDPSIRVRVETLQRSMDNFIEELFSRP